MAEGGAFKDILRWLAPVGRNQGSVDSVADTTAEQRAGDALVWSAVGTLVAGPAVWGLAGYGVDQLVGTERVFLPIGVVLGFVVSVYVVFVRFSRL